MTDSEKLDKILATLATMSEELVAQDRRHQSSLDAIAIELSIVHGTVDEMRRVQLAKEKAEEDARYVQTISEVNGHDTVPPGEAA